MESWGFDINTWDFGKDPIESGTSNEPEASNEISAESTNNIGETPILEATANGNSESEITSNVKLLAELNIAELKIHLEKRGQSTLGKKPALVSRMKKYLEDNKFDIATYDFNADDSDPNQIIYETGFHEIFYDKLQLNSAKLESGLSLLNAGHLHKCKEIHTKNGITIEGLVTRETTINQRTVVTLELDDKR